MYKDSKQFLILCASGKGRRMGLDLPKQFLSFNGKSILEITLNKLTSYVDFDKIVIVTREEYINYVEEKVILAPIMPHLKHKIWIVAGGEERQNSVYNGLEFVKSDIDENTYITVHDSVRPFVTKEVTQRVLDKAIEKGCAVCGVRPVDTMRYENKGVIDRDKLFKVQTPQCFKGDLLVKAYEKAMKEEFFGTDDASIFEYYGEEIHLVEGDKSNKKITTKEDLPMKMRIGTGYDVHQLVENRKLILGGEEIPFEKGLLGHSDADVLVHSLIDSILGAMSLGDIGKLFPDTNAEYKDISSMYLLEVVRNKMRENGYTLVNCDMTIKCQKPKLRPYIDKMRENIANILEVDVSNVNIKATTTETLGFEGRMEGISAEAVSLLSGSYI